MTSQVFANGLVAASFWALVGVGFALLHRVNRFFHFCHAAVIAIGAYACYSFGHWLGVPLLGAAFLGVMCAAIVGVGMDLLVYRPLRRRNASDLVLLLASLGTYVLLQNTIALVFGSQTLTLRSAPGAEGVAVWGARLTPVQITAMVAAPVLIGLVTLLRSRSRIGRNFRAVADDPELAIVSGIAVGSVRRWSFFLGSMLAGIAGVLIGLDVDITPGMGMNPFLFGVVCAVIAGMRAEWAIGLAALVVGMAQHVGAWYLGACWQDPIAFLVLAGFMVTTQFRWRLRGVRLEVAGT